MSSLVFLFFFLTTEFGAEDMDTDVNVDPGQARVGIKPITFLYLYFGYELIF